MRKFIIALSAIVAVACAGSDEGKERVVNIDNIPSQMIYADDLKRIHIDSLLLARPYSISYYPDDILLVKDKKLGELATVIDLKINRVSPLVKSGRSKYELLSLMNMTLLDGDVWLYSFMDSKMLKMEFDANSRTFTPSDLYQFDNRYFGVLPRHDGRFIALSAMGANSRMVLLDGDENLLQEFGVYPQCETPELCDSSTVQSIMTLSPNGENLAVACLSLEHIGIYGPDLEERANSYGQFCQDVKFERVTRGEMSFVTQKPHYFAFENIISNEDGFWIGYLGVQPTDDNPGSVAIRKIIKWDWNGEIEQVYELDQPIISFDIDFESNTLYCITKETEPQIKTIKLP